MVIIEFRKKEDFKFSKEEVVNVIISNNYTTRNCPQLDAARSGLVEEGHPIS